MDTTKASDKLKDSINALMASLGAPSKGMNVLSASDREAFTAAARDRGLTDGEIDTVITVYGTPEGQVALHALAQVATFASGIRTALNTASGALKTLKFQEGQQERINEFSAYLDQWNQQIKESFREMARISEGLAGVQAAAGVIQYGTDWQATPVMRSSSYFENALDVALSTALTYNAAPNDDKVTGGQGNSISNTSLYTRLLQTALLNGRRA